MVPLTGTLGGTACLPGSSRPCWRDLGFGLLAGIPDEPIQPIPPRPSLTFLDAERGKLAGLHPAWHVWYGLRQHDGGSLAVTWHARPHPTISGATSPGDLGARIDQVMTSAYLSAREGDAAERRPRDSSAMRD